MKAKILEAQKEAHDLETLYRSDPEAFIKAFPEAYAEKPDSELFAFWQERLFYDIPCAKNTNSATLNQDKPIRNFLLILSFCLMGGLIAKIPWFFKTINEDLYYMRNLSFFFLSFMTFYYLIQRKISLKKWLLPLEIMILSVLYINLLPNIIFPGKMNPVSDTLILACIHLPILIWFTGGFAFLTPDFNNLTNRLTFLKRNGEIFIYTVLILLGGIVLTGISMAIFDMANISTEWIGEWMVVFGSVSAPIVGTALVNGKGKNFVSFAPLLSKIFTPLFTLTILGFLLTIVIQRKNPFLDRDFLLVINILLVVVVAITTFVIIDRPKLQKITLFDYLTLLLLIFSLGIEFIAFYSVVARLKVNGFTPNRTALMGINMILLIHLCGMIIHMFRWLYKKVSFDANLNWISYYVPIYFYWSVFMVFFYPWVYSLR